VPLPLLSHSARFYSPLAGRFISEDPIGTFSTAVVNLHDYVDSNPIGFADPDGLSKTYDCGAGCGFRIERDPHKGLHINWAATKLDGPRARGRKGYRKVLMVAVIAARTRIRCKPSRNKANPSRAWTV
jgi:hypothetical protein